MKNKYVFVAVMLCCILFISVGFTNLYVNQNSSPGKEEDFVIVTSFYPMYIATMNVVEDIPGVTLKNLSEPETGCLHDFQLTPADMKLLSTADVFIMNGGGIESFMEEIAEEYPNLTVINACEGIELLGGVHEHENEHEHEHEEEATHEDERNAHAWMSLSLHRQQLGKIAEGLKEANPANKVEYERNAAKYDEKLEKLEEKQQELRKLTKEKAAIMFHCAFDYVAQDYGLQVAYCMDLDEERQVSAGEVANVLSIIEKDDVKFVFAEELYAKSMCETVQKEADVRVIYLDPLTRGEYDADSYIEGMTDNMNLIKDAFLQEE